MTHSAKEHLALWGGENGRERLTEALMEMDVGSLTEEFRAVMDHMTVETYDGELVSAYLEVLDDKDPPPPPSDPRESFIAIIEKSVSLGYLTRAEGDDLLLDFDRA